MQAASAYLASTTIPTQPSRSFTSASLNARLSGLPLEGGVARVRVVRGLDYDGRGEMSPGGGGGGVGAGQGGLIMSSSPHTRVRTGQPPHSGESLLGGDEATRAQQPSASGNVTPRSNPGQKVSRRKYTISSWLGRCTRGNLFNRGVKRWVFVKNS